MSASNADDPSNVLKDDPLLKQVPEVEGYKVLEPCVLYAKVGEGGMGAVYRGRHLNLDIDVAIKCLKNALAEQSPAFVTRFQREARIAASVHHQNLVQVYDISHKNGVHYLVMEFVKGETARERVMRKKRLSESEASKVMVGAASGLAEAHGQRIVHRDIKPDNILISFDGKVKVSDLGLAKALEVDGSPSLTMGVMGTPQYMAPEQWDDAAVVGPQADVWALGATLYFLLTGEHAIPGGSMQQIYKKICVDPFPDIRQKLPTISAELKAILDKCIQRDPQKRYVDCRELLRELVKLSIKDAPQLADAESGTFKVPPLLSPPPAETLGHIKVAIRGEDGGKVSMKPPSQAGVDSKAPAQPAAIADPGARAPAEPPLPRPNRFKAWQALAVVAVVAVGWLGVKSVLGGPPSDPSGRTPGIKLNPRIALSVKETTDSGDIEITGTVVELKGALDLDVDPEAPGTPATVTLDESGAFTQSVRLPKKGTYTITVSSGEVKETAVVTFTPRTPVLALDLQEQTSVRKITAKIQITGASSATLRVDPTIAGYPMDVEAGDLPIELPKEDTYTFTLEADGATPQTKRVMYALLAEDLTPDAVPEFSRSADIVLSGLVKNVRGTPNLQVSPTIDGLDLSLPLTEEGQFKRQVHLPNEGRFAFEVVSHDGSTRLWDFTIVHDLTPPTIAWDETGKPSSPTKANTALLKLVFLDELSGMKSARIESGGKLVQTINDTTQAAPIQIKLAEQANNQFDVIALDRCDNESPRLSFSILHDSIGPQLLQGSPSGEVKLKPGLQDFVLDFDEDLDTVLINGEPPPDALGGELRNQAKIRLDVGEDPPFSFDWSATDGLGNPSEGTLTWGVDNTPVAPQGLVADESSGGITIDSKFLAKRATDEGTGITFRLVESLQLYVAETEVTFKQFSKWADSDVPEGSEDDLPVTDISWQQATKFCKAFGYRLPTQQEWRTACLAGGETYCFGSNERELPQYAWYEWTKKTNPEAPPKEPKPVKLKRPNSWDLFDMHGNVWEWCSDEVDGKNRRKLGGSFSTSAKFCAGDSFVVGPSSAAPDTGFRPVKSIN